MERELKRRLAAKAARKGVEEGVDGPDGEYAIEPPPDSGVRPSASAFPVEHTPMRPLTYSVYTVSELDEMRPRQPSLVQAAPVEERSDFRDVARSAVVLFRAVRAWLQLPKPRPKLSETCRIPFTALSADTRAALTRLPWKKIAVYGPITVVVMFLFLFAVLAVVDDDVKPASPVRKPAVMQAAAAKAADAKPADPTPADPKAAEAKPAEPPPIEILDDDKPGSKKAAAVAAAAKKAKPKKKPAEVFIP